MKKYIFEIVVYFLLPVIVIAFVSEYSLRNIPNDYRFKNKWLTQNSKDVEILALGASSVLHNINPEYFHAEGFNSAHYSQSFNFDQYIFNKFIDDMPSLRYVIVGVEYWSPFGFMEDSDEWWRVKFYNIYYGSNFYKWESKYNYELYYHDINTFKKAGKGLLTLVGLKNESELTVDDRGFGDKYTLDNRREEWDDGARAASGHNALITEGFNLDRINQNKEYLEDIIRKSEERDITVILVKLPIYKSYRENLKNEYIIQQNEFCNYFAAKYDNVLFLDFSDDQRFTEDDYYDANHLNETGAKKFTLMLDSIMVDNAI